MERQHYLQLHFDVWFDPSVRKFSAFWRCAILDLLSYAVRSTEPGIITLSTPQLALMLGFRKLDKFADFLDILEERRIIAYSKDDEAIIINPNYIPQVRTNYAGDVFPRRRKPSEMPDRQAERKRASRANQQKIDYTESPNVTPQARDIAASSHTIREDNTTQEIRTEQQHGATEQIANNSVVVAYSPPAILDALEDCGVTRTTAETLIREYGEMRCRIQVANLPHRCATDPPAVLVQSIREEWAAPSAIRHAQEQIRARDAQRQQQAERQASQAQKAAAAEAEAKEFDRQVDAMSDADRKTLRTDAIKNLPAALKTIYNRSQMKSEIIQGAVRSIEQQLLQARQT